jgi:hypothetical protein
MPFEDSRGEELAIEGEAPPSTGGACCWLLAATDRQMAVPGSAQLSEAALESWQPEPVDADPTTAGTSARCFK